LVSFKYALIETFGFPESPDRNTYAADHRSSVTTLRRPVAVSAWHWAGGPIGRHPRRTTRCVYYERNCALTYVALGASSLPHGCEFCSKAREDTQCVPLLSRLP
jgi:hypothetical protein